MNLQPTAHARPALHLVDAAPRHHRDAHRRDAHGQRQERGDSEAVPSAVRHLAQEHPRTVVLVPSKELAGRTRPKLRAMLPSHLSVGYYSASLGRKVPDADVIVATIGSIYRDAHLLGNIIGGGGNECHLINPDGAGPGASASS